MVRWLKERNGMADTTKYGKYIISHLKEQVVEKHPGVRMEEFERTKAAGFFSSMMR